jgi:hypothetical protein
MKAQGKWDLHHLHQTATIAPKTQGVIQTGNKTAKVRKAINRMANYSRDAA